MNLLSIIYLICMLLSIIEIFIDKKNRWAWLSGTMGWFSALVLSLK